MAPRLSRARQSKLDSAFARVDRDDALRKQGMCCFYCFDPLTYRTATRDHVEPRSAGGLDRRTNIVAACEDCNTAKGSLPYGEFMRLITTPQAGDSITYRLIWSRIRINKRLIKMEDTVMRAVGRR